MPKWLVAGSAAYKIVANHGDTIETVVEAGSTDPAVLGKTVVWTRAEIKCNVQAGVLKITDLPPKKSVAKKAKAAQEIWG